MNSILRIAVSILALIAFVDARAKSPFPKLASKAFIQGGGKFPATMVKPLYEALMDVAALNGRSIPRVLILGYASELPEESCADLGENLLKGGKAEIVYAYRSSPESNKRHAADLNAGRYDGTLFTGGDQAVLTARLSPELKEAITRNYLLGKIIYYGTSASAAIASEVMILGTGLGYGPGLSLMPKSVFDQHFIRRQREKRLVQALKKAGPEFFGIGFDEDNAASLTYDAANSAFHIVPYGPNVLTIYKPDYSGSWTAFTVPAGESYDWKSKITPKPKTPRPSVPCFDHSK